MLMKQIGGWTAILCEVVMEENKDFEYYWSLSSYNKSFFVWDVFMADA
jgi:hypothetical protein